MYIAAPYWKELNSNVFVVAIPNTTSPSAKIRTNFDSTTDETSSALTGVSYTGMRQLKIASGNPENMVAVINTSNTENFGWYSTNGGSSWSYTSAISTTHGWPCGISYDGKVMGFARAYSSSNTYWYSSDSGANWSNKSVGTINNRGIAYNNDGSKGFIVNYSSTTAYLITSISTLTSKTLPWAASDCYMNRAGTRIWITQASNASNTLVAYSDNDGTSWNSVTVEAGVGIVTNNPHIRGSDDGQHLLLNAGPTKTFLYTSNNYGTTWNKVTIGAGIYSAAISVSRSGKYMVAGSNAENGKYYYSTDYGQTWSNTTISGVTAPFFAIGIQEF